MNLTDAQKENIKKMTADARVILSKRAMPTIDSFENFISRVGVSPSSQDNALSNSTYVFNLITRNRVLLEAAYRGSWVVGAVIDSVAEDMTRAGLEISTNDDDSDLKEIFNAISRLKLWNSFKIATQWGDLYGGAIGVLQIQGQNLKTPLDLDTIDKDQFQGIVSYDRWQLNPVLDSVIDSGPDMGLPEFYDIVSDLTSSFPTAKTATGQTRVHHSRVIRFIGIELPFFQAITEMMWGESVLERLWDRLISFDNATMSSANLIDRANLRTVSIEGLREIVADGGEALDGLKAQMEMMREFQVNEGLTILDTKDTFASTAYSFAGLSDMMLQFGQQLSGASKIPLIRLFGQAPAGLGDTGDSVLRTYYDYVNAKQESKYRNGWELVLKVLWRSVYGKPSPKDLEFKFTPLWQMSATDKATNAKTQTETIIGAFDVGLINKPAAMKDLRAISDDTGLFANITDDDIADAEAEKDDPPMPGEVDPAAPANPDDPQVVKPPPSPVPGLDAKPNLFKKLFKRNKK